MVEDMTNSGDLFSPIGDVGFAQWLLADLESDFAEKVGRFRMLDDLCSSLGSGGTLMPGGETKFAAWAELRSSFIHGNLVATILLAQALVENILAGNLLLRFDAQSLPPKISFSETIKRSIARGTISNELAKDLRRLCELRNPLTHFRDINDPSNLTRRVLDTQVNLEEHLRRDATFALTTAVRVLALPSFRVG
ncbi:hypothetical protein [Sphingopyxis sp. JAI128]|uniref:hypothetical protein n=1 Tax=Sphingopyxis sp. JAI128 TaxID=2723066 RepID=UPI001845EE0B|nr:hypothetical protein [Sphingopyxis sp. JAI128]MBB6425780.1 hypothetical protein [Sphingopyxis sp. JAI128]